VVTVALQPLKTVGRCLGHASDRSGYFLVVFLVVFFADLAFFFIAMALVTSFQLTNVRTAKLSVNDFFMLR